MIRFPRLLSRSGRSLAIGLLLPLLGSAHARAAEPGDTTYPVKPRARIIVDNDFGGDPDGLFQLAHHLLSPSVEVPGIIGSHHYKNGFYGYPGSAAHGVEMAKELLETMNLTGKIPVLQGAEETLQSTSAPQPSEAARFIVSEAMRQDPAPPLYVVCGAGLTDLAGALLAEPKVAERITLVWIGGPEHPDLAAPPPGKRQVEYNLGIDVKAAQVVFNQSTVPIWQVPRNSYHQALVSHAELQARLGSGGRLGGYLTGRLGDLLQRAKGALGEAYILGDSPLVLLTALQSAWEPDAASSHHLQRNCPKISDDGWYQPDPTGRQIRVYGDLDTRLMFDDLYAKVSRFDKQP